MADTDQITELRQLIAELQGQVQALEALAPKQTAQETCRTLIRVLKSVISQVPGTITNHKMIEILDSAEQALEQPD